MNETHRPRPSLPFAQDIADWVEPVFSVFHSGELSASVVGKPIGAAIRPGRIRDVWMSVLKSGVGESAVSLVVSGEVYINGVTCHLTTPKIAFVSGETSTHKTTLLTGDTGITQASIDEANNSVDAGDIFSCDLLVQRTSPDEEIENVVLVVDFLPDYP